jgi:hypothetical protein
MITNPAGYAMFKRRSSAEEVLDLSEKYEILEALYREARQLGHFSQHDLLLGLEDDVRLAAALNANVSNAPH